jgi:hypothetical protein
MLLDMGAPLILRRPDQRPVTRLVGSASRRGIRCRLSVSAWKSLCNSYLCFWLNLRMRLSLLYDTFTVALLPLGSGVRGRVPIHYTSRLPMVMSCFGQE